MCSLFLDGLVVSLTQVVSGQVGIQFQPCRAEDIDVWEKLSAILTDSGKLLYADRNDGIVTYVTRFASPAEARQFLAQRFDTEIVRKDEFSTIAA